VEPVEFETILFESDDKVAKVSLNRPDALNAINNKMRQELIAAIEEIGNNDQYRVFVMTGKGKAFCAGGDVKGMGTQERPINPSQIILRLASLDKPVISAVNGVAAGGGCNLALAGDIILASDQARFIQSFVRIGLVPDWGGMYFLPRLVGMAKAKELMFTGESIDAKEAERIGLVSKVISMEEFEATVNSLAKKLAAGPPRSLSLIKKILNWGQPSDLKTVMELEYLAQGICRETEDHKEGLKAFKEKREPNFTGK
jgi:2-(1,2-epoxy-1,2-dihydrophenyl)acetyl-CoA isomerase